MSALRGLMDRLGIQVNSDTILLLISLLLATGAATVVTPIFSFFRAVLSLFVLPGKPVGNTLVNLCDTFLTYS